MSKLQHTLGFSTEARKKLKVGIDKISDAVKITLGPKGRNVVIEKEWGFPTITKDGVTVANEVSLTDQYEKMGASMFREASVMTADEIGDKTTGCLVLAQAIATEGLKQVEAGVSPIDIKRAIEKRGAEVVKGLKKLSKPIQSTEEIEQIASISANNKEIGKVIAETIEKVGKDGMLVAEASNTLGINSEITTGYSFERGVLPPYLKKGKFIMDKPNIVILEEKLSTFDEAVEILKNYVKKDLIIIAPDIESAAMEAILVNKVEGNVNCVGIKAPEFGDLQEAMLDDIRCITDGVAKKAIMTKDTTTIIGEKNPKERIKEIREQVKTASQFDRVALESRIAKLSGGMAIIKVGASTETETNEIKDRVDDCIGAVKSALQEGILAGGGVSLVKLATKDTILDRAMLKPAKQIAENAGKDGSEVVYKIKDTGLGYNAETDVFEDLMEAGVIDSLKAERVALENAISVATMFLMVEVVIFKQEKND